MSATGAAAYPIININGSDYLLVGREKDGIYKGQYSLFAGRWEIEDGLISGKKDFFKTIRRELKEECGIKDVVLSLKDKNPSIYLKKTPIWLFRVPNSIRKHHFVENDEMDDMEFVSIDKLIDASILKKNKIDGIHISKFVLSATYHLFLYRLISYS